LDIVSVISTLSLLLKVFGHDSNKRLHGKHLASPTFPVNVIFSKVQPLKYNKICTGFNPKMGARKPLSATRLCALKTKFHYANFATKFSTMSQILSQTWIMKVRDTNYVADFHNLCRGLSWFWT